MKKKTLHTIIAAVLIIIIVFFVIKYNQTPDLEPKDLPDPILGPENATTEIIIYSDFECPYCAAAAGHHDVLIARFKSQMPSWEAPVPELERLAKEGKIKLVFKHFPLNFHDYAQKAAEASEAANAQGKFWEFHDKLYETQGKFTEETLFEIAKELDLDMKQFKAELDQDVYAKSVRDDMREGQNLGITGTPAFIINGELLEGAQPFSVFEQKLGLIE